MKTPALMASALFLALASPVFAQEVEFDVIKAVKACGGEIRKVCSGIEPGDGRIKACVKEKFAELSTGCKDALGELIAARVQLPDDGANVVAKHFEDLRASHYTEIFLIAGDPIDGDLHANVYNTLGLNGYNDHQQEFVPRCDGGESQRRIDEEGVQGPRRARQRPQALDAGLDRVPPA